MLGYFRGATAASRWGQAWNVRCSSKAWHSGCAFQGSTMIISYPYPAPFQSMLGPAHQICMSDIEYSGCTFQGLAIAVVPTKPPSTCLRR